MKYNPRPVMEELLEELTELINKYKGKECEKYQSIARIDVYNSGFLELFDKDGKYVFPTPFDKKGKLTDQMLEDVEFEDKVELFIYEITWRDAESCQIGFHNLYKFISFLSWPKGSYNMTCQTIEGKESLVFKKEWS